MVGNINVLIEWDSIPWHTISFHDVRVELDPDDGCWKKTSVISEVQCSHQAREQCWCEDGFTPLMEWIDTDLAAVTHLGFV